jgi:hypothetical protein
LAEAIVGWLGDLLQMGAASGKATSRAVLAASAING